MNEENFKINLNQNLWALIIALLTLGTAEHFKLCTLYWFGLILSVATSISLILTLRAYTINYCKSKMNG